MNGTELLLVIVGFLLGSLMFSFWIGELALKRDIREVGDGNPGAFNLLAVNRAWGMVGVLLDIFKGAVTPFIARWVLGIDGAPLFFIAVAPVLGHAFSPWLSFRGGKAIAVTYGVWMGLTIWEMSVFMPLVLVLWFKIVKGSGWAVMLTLAVIMIYYLITYPNPAYLLILLTHWALLAYKYRDDLRQPLDLRDSFKRRLWRTT
jgi:acyl phosphate:glycerol-3-phosphate acyltransferase